MTKKALCLSGGATRGSFQMGAIKFLYEQYGFRPDIITGTSIGAINGIKLACAPPPAVNDTEAILAAVAAGTVDPQLAHMRELEQIWANVQGRADFFLISQAFKGTIVDDALKDPSPPVDWTSMLADHLVPLSVPVVNFFAAIGTVIELLTKWAPLKDKIFSEDGVATLFPVEMALRGGPNGPAVNLGAPGDKPPYTNNLYHGTPLYLAAVSLENGKLRFANHKGELYERDGVTPVATALNSTDIAAALDENLNPLTQPHQDRITTAVANYQAALQQSIALQAQLSNAGTSALLQEEIQVGLEREQQRASYWAQAAEAQIQGVRITATVQWLGRPDAIRAALASASLPVLLDPPEIGGEHYCDAGLREIVPVDVVLDKSVTEVIGILCSKPDLVGGDSMQKVGLINVGLRAATEILIAEVTLGDLAKAESSGIPTRIIAPQLDVHSGLDIKPSLIEIAMHYGWMRAADAMHLVAAEQDECARTSELITRLRRRCWEIETIVRDEPLRMSADAAKWSYFELRVNRWAIMYLSDRRGALGLPPHPDQVQLGWATRWEKEFRDPAPLSPTVWSAIQAQLSDPQGIFTVGLWPASSPRQFNPDVGSIEDAGSDRIYWLVRGAIFEDPARGPLSHPEANVVVPTGLHQFLPTIPDGAHLMAEIQAPMTLFLVIGGKKYASPTAQWIAAAGLTGAATALVPAGGLAQIPDGGKPFFLGDLTVVDEVHWQPLAEVRLERLQGSSSTADILLYNRSAATVTIIDVTLGGVGAAEGVTVGRVPASIGANSIDSITLRLNPATASVIQGSISIASDDTVFPLITVGLTLVVQPLGDMPALQLTPLPLEIAAPVNSTTSYSTVTITNAGTRAPERVIPYVESPGNVPLFTVGGPGIGLDGELVAPGALQPGAAVDIAVYFSPAAVGTYTADLVVTASGMTSLNHSYTTTARLPVTGRAGAATIRLLTRTPHPSDFTGGGGGSDVPRTTVNIDIGTVQPPFANAASVFIMNLGTLPLEVATMVGYYATPVVTTSFPIEVPPGEWVEVKLDFGAYHAPVIGQFTDTVRILCNDPVTPEADAVVTGSVAGLRGAMRPESIDFGMVSLNTAVDRESAFLNQGTVDLHIANAAWRRKGGPFTLVSSPLNAVVPAGGSLPVRVEFGPVPTAGAFGDFLIIETTEGITVTLSTQARAA
jgi:predicted acylesterase/phospholipase RssA